MMLKVSVLGVSKKALKGHRDFIMFSIFAIVKLLILHLKTLYCAGLSLTMLFHGGLYLLLLVLCSFLINSAVWAGS